MSLPPTPQHRVNCAKVGLGHQKEFIDIRYLCKWHSRIISITHSAAISFTPNAKGNSWEYPDAQLRKLVNPIEGADLTVAIVSAPIERNYYSRRLGNNVVVYSIHEMAHILRSANFQIEHFILRNIYQIAIYYHVLNGVIPESDSVSWSHHDIRGCLFDMNAQKSDILYSMHQPKLCDACRTRIGQQQVDPNLLSTLDTELPRLRRKLFFQIVDWVKMHPIYSLLLTAAFGITLNILASIIFEKAKRIWPWLG
jgi:hypothetical protein